MHVLYDILNVGAKYMYTAVHGVHSMNLSLNMVWGFCCGKSSTTNSYSFNTLARQKTVL